MFFLQDASGCVQQKQNLSLFNISDLFFSFSFSLFLMRIALSAFALICCTMVGISAAQANGDRGSSHDTPECWIGTDPGTISYGEGTTLWWWTQNAGYGNWYDGYDEDYYGPEGHEWIYPTETTTYKLKVWDDYDNEYWCETTVYVEDGYSCDDGYYWDDSYNECKPDKYECDTGYYWDDYTWACEPYDNKCDDGYSWDDHAWKCVPEKQECHDGYYWDNYAYECKEELDNIVDIALATDALSTLVAALTAADLVPSVQEANPITVFAPLNSAFENLPDGELDRLLLPENKEELAGILGLHVVNGKLPSSKLKNGITLKTWSGERVKIKKDYHGNITVNGIDIVTADIFASNGVVHLIDEVLLPGKYSYNKCDYGYTYYDDYGKCKPTKYECDYGYYWDDTTWGCKKDYGHGGGYSKTPECWIGTDPKSVKYGKGTTLWWWTQHADHGEWKGGYDGDYYGPEGHVWIYPEKTTTYKLKVTNDYGKEYWCETTIEVEKQYYGYDSCDSGYYWDEDAWECKAIRHYCDDGYYWDSEAWKCKSEAKACDYGYYWDNDAWECKRSQETCGYGYYWDENAWECKQEKKECRIGRSWSDEAKRCVRNKRVRCEDGDYWDKNSRTCVPKNDNYCEDGYEWNGYYGKCFKNY